MTQTMTEIGAVEAWVTTTIRADAAFKARFLAIMRENGAKNATEVPIFSRQAEQSTPFPYIVFSQVRMNRNDGINGAVGTVDTVYRVRVYVSGLSNALADSLAFDIQNLLHQHTGAAGGVSITGCVLTTGEDRDVGIMAGKPYSYVGKFFHIWAAPS